jgi:hypothetical protein
MDDYCCSQGYVRQEYVATLPKSTFTILENDDTLTTDKQQYKKGENIRITLSIARNVTIPPEPAYYANWNIRMNQSDDPAYNAYYFYDVGNFQYLDGKTFTATATAATVGGIFYVSIRLPDNIVLVSDNFIVR